MSSAGVGDRTSLQLARSLDTGVDTQAFEAACSAGELNEALPLYGGDFLEGLRIEACPEFEGMGVLSQGSVAWPARACAGKAHRA